MAVMMKLGSFNFEIATAVYQELNEKYKYDWSSQKRIGNNPSLQFTGYSKSISLSGVFYPAKFGKSIDDLITLANDGKPLLMVAGTGKILDYWVINDISQTKTIFFNNGQARKVSFSLELSFYGEKYQ
ncbi:phage tail protein [Lentisphaerota bacterium WC36G]|nr:phage tail protein [Lentisphaerae bacterium WC36]